MKKVAYIGCLGIIGIITTEFGVIGILPQLAAHYNIPIEKAGWLLSAFAMVIAFCGPVVTLLFSRVNRKLIMSIAMGMFIITGVVSALAPPFWLLMTVRVLPAILHPVLISSAIAAAIQAAPPKEATRMMGIVLGGIAIAMVTTVPFATWLAGRFNWQAAFWAQSVISLSALLAMLWGLPQLPKSENESFSSQAAILRDPVFITSSVTNVLLIAAWFCTYSYFADFLGKVKGMDEERISYMLLVFGLAGIPGNWIAGRLLGKNLSLTTAVFLSGALFIPFLSLSVGGGWTVNALILALWGLFYAPCYLTAAAYLTSAAPNAIAFANTLAISYGNLGIVVGTTASGWVIAHYGIASSPWAGAFFALMALGTMAIRNQLVTRRNTASACVPS
ncbi:MFS transporter [Chitinophaga deserti]|uniref:MFS transporter n=1 Tax=Chitinophaga deserti TaxID=2164099 RepID=UPI000D6B93E6|nr:MFS transporter [Chitinophaga deserti]